MLPDEVRKAMDRWDSYLHARATSLSVTATPTLHEWQTIRARLVELEAENERLRKVEEERWSVVATRNAAVMRAEKAEALLRECLAVMELHPATHARITAHLGGENNER